MKIILIDINVWRNSIINTAILPIHSQRVVNINKNNINRILIWSSATAFGQSKIIKMYLKRAQQTFSVIFALFALSVTLYSIVKFIIFISLPSNGVTGISSSAEWKYTLRALFSNSVWLVSFILHHSFGKHKIVKNTWEKIGLKTLDRASYNVISSIILLKLVENWVGVNKWTIWSFAIKDYSPIWYVYVLAHSTLWLIIFGGTLLMDVPEVLGVKQVYYDIKGLYDPSYYKAIPHNRLLTHVRHPSFIGFSLLFWITNLMR